MDNRYKNISRRDAREDPDDDNLFGESAPRHSYYKNTEYDDRYGQDKSSFRKISSPRNKSYYHSGKPFFAINNP